MKLLIILILAFSLSGCTTLKRCNTKFPPPPDKVTTVTNTVTITRDTTIYIRLQADTITATDTVLIASDGLVSFPLQRLDVAHAYSVVWIENSRLRHELIQKDTELAATIADAIREAETTVEVTVERFYPVPARLKWWHYGIMASGWLFMIFRRMR